MDLFSFGRVDGHGLCGWREGCGKADDVLELSGWIVLKCWTDILIDLKQCQLIIADTTLVSNIIFAGK